MTRFASHIFFGFCFISTMLFSSQSCIAAESSRGLNAGLPAHEHSITLTERQECDLEMLLIGAFAPLDGFLQRKDYEKVVIDSRLGNGEVWPMPITLDINETLARSLKKGDHLGLKDEEGTILAFLEVSDIWQPNKFLEADRVYGTTSIDHPGVEYLFEQTEPYYVGGKVKPVRLPHHADFSDLRKTPAQLKQFFKENGIDKVVAFQTRNPMHRAHFELTHRAAKQVDGHLLINPIVGQTKPGDVDPYTRVRCYRKVLTHYPEGSATLCVLPLAMRMAGPREALWHALIRKNYGCTHFIVGRDHAGPGPDRHGNDFYGPYEAQEMVNNFASEIGIEMVPFQMVVYLKNEDRYIPMDEVKEGQKVLNISGTDLRNRLKDGSEIPAWFSFPEVVSELRQAYPLRSQKGFTVFFTGLSGAGKSTLGKALAAKLRETQHRSVSMLDGDLIRKHLSSELGFSQKDRSINVRRVGYVASEITKSGGIAICCLISPFEEDRQFNREIVEGAGGYVEIHVSTPLETCEVRDVKGLYAKARSGEIKQFTGIDDPYEDPSQPHLVIDTTDQGIEETVNTIFNYLSSEGYVEPAAA